VETEAVEAVETEAVEGVETEAVEAVETEAVEGTSEEELFEVAVGDAVEEVGDEAVDLVAVELETVAAEAVEEETAAEAEDVGPEAVVEPVEPSAPLKSARESAAEAEVAAASASAASEEGRKKRTRKPKAAVSSQSSASPGTVNIHAEGYTADGRRRGRRDRKRQRRVDKEAVQENVKKTLAAIGTGTSGRKRRRDSGPKQQEMEQELRAQHEETEKITVRVNEFLTIAELADQIESTPNEIITSAFKNLGLMVTINQRLDFDQIELICDEFGYIVVREEAYEADLPGIQAEQESEEDLAPRAPVVTVMGHVDHGKTSLLDHVRRTNVIAGEAGGITQHIGAYHVELSEGRSVTFLDTPGHEAFTAMRARGAELTDIVILVVAADDAVMPQTIEAISHAKNAGVPILVAINKTDLPAANVAKVKQDLLTHDVVLEEFGGEVLSAEVSAKKGTGIDDLLEKVLLQAEMLDLQARPSGPARGVVIEAELDKGMGSVATVLVQSGELNVGDDFICGMYGGRVRNLLDERGNQVEWAGPSIPVRVLGLEGVPQAGDHLVEMDAARLREVVSRRQQLEREKSMRRKKKGTRLEDIFAQIQAGDRATVNLVIKGDTDGSVQALSDSLERLSTDEVAVDVLHRGVGAITEGDVLLATTGSGAVIGFHVRPDNNARSIAEREGVQIRTYNVIYEAVEDVRLALEGMLAPEEREVIVGSAEVRELFRVPKAGTVAGCYVTSGTMQRNLTVRLLRDYVQIYEGRIGSLRRFKEDVREVKDGYECGISIEGYNDVKVGDIVECFRVEEIARSLAESGSAN
jgi:translation initiation factor IF-2